MNLHSHQHKTNNELYEELPYRTAIKKTIIIIMSNNATMNTLNVRNLNWKINNFSSGSQTTTTTTVFCLPSSSNLSSWKNFLTKKQMENLIYKIVIEGTRKMMIENLENLNFFFKRNCFMSLHSHIQTFFNDGIFQKKKILSNWKFSVSFLLEIQIFIQWFAPMYRFFTIWLYWLYWCNLKIFHMKIDKNWNEWIMSVCQSVSQIWIMFI